jgi:hypothetical protein
MPLSALVLVRFRWQSTFETASQHFGHGTPLVMLCRSVAGSEGYAWLKPDADIERFLSAALGGATLPATTPVVLERLRELDGASAADGAPYRYIVETDVEDGHEADFNAWYDDEHLAGLASAPGTVRAFRYRAPDGRPRYHAYYDLAHPDVLGSPAWLAVRATPWSDRVRPHFVNTKRTMFGICR